MPIVEGIDVRDEEEEEERRRARRRAVTRRAAVPRVRAKEWWRSPEPGVVVAEEKEEQKERKERVGRKPWPGLAAETPWAGAMLPAVLREVSPWTGALAGVGPGPERTALLPGEEGREKREPGRYARFAERARPWFQAAGAAGEMLERTGRLGGLSQTLQQVGQIGETLFPERVTAAEEQFRQQVKRAWEEAEVTPLPGALPEAWERARGLMARPVPAGVVQPEMPGAEMWQPTVTQEQAQQAAQELGAVAFGLPRAFWEEAKVAPGATGGLVRGVEAAGKTGMALYNLATVMTEEKLATEYLQQLPSGWTVPPLGPERYLTEEQQQEALGIARETGRSLYMIQQEILHQARQGQPSIREYTVQTYGPSEATEVALSRLGAGLGYSSYWAQRKAIDRLMAGENLETVASGRQVNVYDPSEEEKAAYQAYIGGIRQREGEDAANAAMMQVQATGLIPGESDLGNEMLFQTILDPLNLLDVFQLVKPRIAQAMAAGRFTEAVDVAGDVARMADDVAAGTGRVLTATAEAGGTGANQAGLMKRVWEQVNPLALTPRSQAEQLAGTAYQVVTPAVMQVADADEARAVVRLMAEDPARLTGVLGNVPVSRAAQEVRPVLAAVVDDLDDVKKFPSLRGPFDRAAFMADLDGAMLARAMEATGASVEELNWYEKFAGSYKNLMSKFYLRTPGYAIRNAMGDIVTMAWDGVMTLDGRTAIDDFMKRFGPTTRRVSGAAAGSQLEAVGRWGEKATGLAGAVEKVTGPLGRAIGKQEEARYLRAFYSGLKKGLKRVWRPGVPDELVELVGADVARRLSRGMANAVNEREMVRVIKQAVGEGGRWVDLGRYVDDPDDLSVGMRLALEQRLGAIDDVGEVDGIVDEFVEQVRERAGQTFAVDPTPPGRRVWSDVEAVQDLVEEQGYIEGLGTVMGVSDEETAAAAERLAEALRPGEVAIREAEEGLAAAAGGALDEGSADLMRSVRAETGRMKMEARAAADQLRAAAWEAYRATDDYAQKGRIWRDYFDQVERLYRANQDDVLRRLGEAGEQLSRLRAGEMFEDVMGRPVQEVVEESLAQLRALSQDVATRREKWRRWGIEEFADFDRMLDAQRLTVDAAEAEAWRLMAMNPSRDGLDIVMSTQDGVDQLARAAVSEMKSVRARYLRKLMSREKYQELGDAIWGGYFRNASQGWDLARWELSQLPLSPGAQRKALTALGWPAEQVARLGPEEIKAVLGAGVRWDAMLDAPSMALSEAMRGTLAEVAGAAGLDLARSADWTPAQWDSLAIQARAMANEAGARASQAGRIAQAAAEVGAEMAVGAPQTVRAGMNVVWPASVDDVARSMGLRPQTMGPDEWAQVAEYAVAKMVPDDPLATRWMEMVEDAQRRVAGGGVVSSPGMYDAAGFPVAREGVRPGRVSQRAVVERAAGMVPEEARLGRAGATVGFEQQQAWLAQRYTDLEDMAKARATLLRDGRRLGEVLDVPVDAVKVSTRKETGLYWVDMVSEDKRVIQSYAFENWSEARAARDQAREIIEAGQQGQQAATGVAWSSWGTEDVSRADRRAAAAGGYAGAPTLADAAAVQEQVELTALENIRAGVKMEWGAAEGMGELPPMAKRQLMEWVEGPLAREWIEARTVAVEMAREGADFALLDYSKRRRLDSWLGMVFPYTFWKTRNGRNYLLRFMERPGALAAYGRLKEAQRRRQMEKGYRARFEGQVEIPVEALPEWMGGAVFVDPAGLMPWTQILGPEWVADPAEADTTLEMAYRVSQRLGMRPYGFIEWPLQYANWIGEGAEEIGYVLPHTGAVQALTAMAGVGPPGGVSIERGVRRMFNLPEQEPYGAYRVEREVSNMAADIMADEVRRDPRLVQTGMIAQELQRLAHVGELDLRAAMGWGDASQRPVERVAMEQGWSEAQLRAGQEMLQEAVRRAAVERGIGTLSSFFAGVPVRVYPSGERRQVELEREQRARQYSPLTERGTREELEAFREAHPEAVLRRLARTGLPGAGELEEEQWTPGEAWQSAEYDRRKGEVERTYAAAREELLRERPWDREGLQELEDQMWAELDVLRDEIFGAEEEEEEEEVYVRSVWGAAPEEALAIRHEEVLGAVSAAMPHTEDFEDEEGVLDYEAYRQAVDAFFSELPERMAGDEKMAAIREAMREEVGGVGGVAAGGRPGLPRLPVREERVPAIAQLLEGIDREEVTAYWRRNDTPLEALQRVYEDEVYSRAWDRYNWAVERGLDKSEAYERFIERAGVGRAVDLVHEVLEAYPDRWTREELETAYEGVEFPAVGEVRLLRKPEEEQALERGKSAFWDLYNEGIPPGKMASGAREYTLVELVLDAETRGTATAEQYERAVEWLEEWKAKNKSDEWLTPADWAEARRSDEEFDALIEKWLPGVEELLDEYYDLSWSEQTAFKKEHPEIEDYYDAREWFGDQPGNELWAYFYLGDEAALARIGAGRPGPGGYVAAEVPTVGVGAYGEREYVRQPYYRGYGGGGGGGGRVSAAEPDWRFAYQARRVPKVYLETPSPWEGALRGETFRRRWEEEPYRARGVPWVFGKWRRTT